MRNFISGMGLAAIVMLAVAATQRDSGFSIVNGFGGEPAFSAQNASQSADWINFKSNGVAVFRVPASGIIPVANGGTGSATGGAALASLGAQPAAATLTNIDALLAAKQPATTTLTNIDSLLSAKQPGTAYLTNWSAIATTTKMASGAGGTIDGGGLTNLANAPIVVAAGGTPGITVTPTTNPTTGQITYTLSVP